MRVVLQRVSRACVRVGDEVVGEVGRGLVVLLGIGKGDTEAMVVEMAQKIVHMRIFADANDKMNVSLLDVAGGCLLVSQFTLYADTERGRRPYFGDAEDPARAKALCEVFATALRALQVPQVATGRFGAMMQVELVNDGPVTILLESAPSIIA